MTISTVRIMADLVCNKVKTEVKRITMTNAPWGFLNIAVMLVKLRSINRSLVTVFTEMCTG